MSRLLLVKVKSCNVATSDTTRNPPYSVLARVSSSRSGSSYCVTRFFYGNPVGNLSSNCSLGVAKEESSGKDGLLEAFTISMAGPDSSDYLLFHCYAGDTKPVRLTARIFYPLGFIGSMEWFVMSFWERKGHGNILTFA